MPFPVRLPTITGVHRPNIEGGRTAKRSSKSKLANKNATDKVGLPHFLCSASFGRKQLFDFFVVVLNVTEIEGQQKTNNR